MFKLAVRKYDLLFVVVDPYPAPNGDIRLVGGVNSYEGRVEMLFNGIWGTVCQDHFGNEDAAIVCRQLGLEVSSKIIIGRNISANLRWWVALLKAEKLILAT